MVSTKNDKEVWEVYFEVAPEKVLYKDDKVVVFADRSPGAVIHLLVVPRHRHIKGVEDLTPSDRQLLQTMGRVGQQLAHCDLSHMGFHQWPMRSVDHLHLHCIVPPFTPAWQKARYTEIFGSHSRFGFISLPSVLGRISRD